MYVKVLSKQRSQLITDILDTTLSHFPDEIESHRFLSQVAKKLEAFFLTDHCAGLENEECASDNLTSLLMTPLKIKKNYQAVDNVIMTPAPKEAAPAQESPDSGVIDNTPPTPSLQQTVTSPVVPITRKARRSHELRKTDAAELRMSGVSANLLVDDDRSQADLVPSYEAPVPTVSAMGTSWLGTFIDNNPFMFMGIFAAATKFIQNAGGMVVTIDLDILLLIAFAAFCVGLHTPRPLVGGVDKPPLKRRGRRNGTAPSTPTSASKLLRRSMISTTPRAADGTSSARRNLHDDVILEEVEAEVDEGEDDICIQSPMPMFPEGAPLGTHNNCWSSAPAEGFLVRGDKYLRDKKKVPSAPFLFKARGIDLFLTDACPENCGR